MVVQTLVIRQMKPADAAAVAALSGQLGYPASEQDIVRRYDQIRQRQDARLFVAEAFDGRVVGWIQVQAMHLIEYEPRASILGLVVDEHVRGNGVGRALVEAAEAWALQRGLPLMAVNSNAIRSDAKAFYERLGYSVVKTQNSFRKTLQ